MEILLVQVFMRWLHIASVAALVGGMLYAGLVLGAGCGAVAPEGREQVWRRASACFRPVAFVAVAALIVSGIYNIVSAPGHSPRYHMWLGIKLLLAGHVVAVALMAGLGKARRPARSMGIAAISGLAVIAISAYLRRIF